MIAALSGVMDDPIGPYPRRGKLSSGRVSGFQGDLAQDEVSLIYSTQPSFACTSSFCWRLSLSFRPDNPC